ncbi:MAG: FAD-binding oxidoreductase [Acidobacteria bacterium]|nr:FAD-binding oxidoreductase [Acidobacteriota bacterium]
MPVLQQNAPTHPRLSRAFVPERAFDALARTVGPEHVEAFDNDGEAFVVSPASAGEVCEVLRLAEVEGLCVVPAGGETWLDAGEPLRRAPHIILRTTRMSRIVAHEPADLVATVEAGATLEAFNSEIRRAGQWLALDPPGDGGLATLGGIVATGTGGAQSYVYGAPRAHVLGMTVALAGGKIIRAGGRVVKNVAGYDLCKLFAGSYGTLGLILDLTFKLRPRPPREATVLALSADPDALLEASRSLRSAPLLPVAIELLSPQMCAKLDAPCVVEGCALLVRFAGTDESVADQMERAREIIRGQLKQGSVEIVYEDAHLWAALAATRLGNDEGLVWRACVRPGDLGALLAEIRNAYGGKLDSCWHAGVGDGRFRYIERAGDEVVDASRLRSLRNFVCGLGGSLVIEHAPEAIKRSSGAWGLTAPTASLMRRVKEQLDPGDMFSPGRFAFASDG